MSGELGEALAQKVTTKMPREQLEQYIANTLKKQTMCTLVTSKGDIPRGTPLEYFSDGLTLYIAPDPGTKTKNLKVNSNVGISIYNNVSPDWENDWPIVWGMQITARGELFEDGALEHARGREVIDFKAFFRALGRAAPMFMDEDTKLSKRRKVLKVTPSKIELFELGLIDKGFAHRQVWRAKA